MAELAQPAGIAVSYVTRILGLMLLAPDIVEAILNGRHGPEITLARLLNPTPATWTGQRRTLTLG